MTVTFRPGTLDDLRATHNLFVESLLDLGERQGTPAFPEGDDPDALAKLWAGHRPLWEHLARTAAHFWIAEQGGEAVGYARSILRQDVLQLTDLFVRSDQQAGGVGRELLARAFPEGEAARHAIVATSDLPAVVRYLKRGLTPRSPMYWFGRQAEPVEVETDLTIEPVSESPETLAALGDIDAVVLGYRHDEDHRWMLTERQGYLYSRGGQPVGYGYVGEMNGPFAVLGQGDFPAVLAHAETQVAARGGHFGVELPLVNRVAVDALLARGYRMDPFINYFMADAPFGKLENYAFNELPLFS